MDALEKRKRKQLKNIIDVNKARENERITLDLTLTAATSLQQTFNAAEAGGLILCSQD